ncbi:MAG: hypothetical protein ACYSWO_29380 [Planctomycetota bacterium]|jgi:hypothetical protein
MNLQDQIAAFAAVYGWPDEKFDKLKRSRKFACTACGKAIPPGKPDRRCKECREKGIILDESGPLIHITDLHDIDTGDFASYEAIIEEQEMTPEKDEITIIDDSEKDEITIIDDSEKDEITIIDDSTTLCDLCNQAATSACDTCDYRGLKDA